MIRENELRVGNWVIDIFYDTPIKITKHFFSEGNVNNIEPIELTEEILLKCGFRKENNVIPIYTLDLISIYWNSEYYPNGRLYFNSWCIYKEKPKHLHQLQNLYFALTGTELKINL